MLSHCPQYSWSTCSSIHPAGLLNTWSELHQTWWTSTGLPIQRWFWSDHVPAIIFPPKVCLPCNISYSAILRLETLQLVRILKKRAKARKESSLKRAQCWKQTQDADWLFPTLGLEKLRRPWEQVLRGSTTTFIFSKHFWGQNMKILDSTSRRKKIWKQVWGNIPFPRWLEVLLGLSRWTKSRERRWPRIRWPWSWLWNYNHRLSNNLW